MNFFRWIFHVVFHRRRQRQKCFLILVVLSLPIIYCTIEFPRRQINERTIISTSSDHKAHSREDPYGRPDEILSKYVQEPYNIDVWSIIHEARRKYEQKSTGDNENRYVVYSCPFMCGGELHWLSAAK